MSSLTALLLCAVGIVIVYIGVGYLPIANRTIIAPKILLRMFGAMTVVLLVGMGWVQQTSEDSVAALQQAGDVVYQQCLQRNVGIELNLSDYDTRIAEAERDVIEDEEALEALLADPPTAVDDVPLISDIEDPAVREVLAALADVSRADYDAEILTVRGHLANTQEDLRQVTADKEAFAVAVPLRDCVEDWPDAARRAGDL